MNTYMIGTTVRLQAVFAVNAVSQDPVTATFTLAAPDGSITALTVAHDATGEYHVDYTPTLPGLYTWRAAAAGFTSLPSIGGASEGSFFVYTSGIL
jgi:hypothetical protein